MKTFSQFTEALTPRENNNRLMDVFHKNGFFKQTPEEKEASKKRIKDNAERMEKINKKLYGPDSL